MRSRLSRSCGVVVRRIAGLSIGLALFWGGVLVLSPALRWIRDDARRGRDPGEERAAIAQYLRLRPGAHLELLYEPRLSQRLPTTHFWSVQVEPARMYRGAMYALVSSRSNGVGWDLHAALLTGDDRDRLSGQFLVQGAGFPGGRGEDAESLSSLSDALVRDAGR